MTTHDNPTHDAGGIWHYSSLVLDWPCLAESVTISYKVGQLPALAKALATASA